MIRFLFTIIFFNLYIQTLYAQSQVDERISIEKEGKLLNQLGGRDIFPKSKVDDTINPIFNQDTFDVNNALKGDMEQFKSKEKFGGINNQFKLPSKEVDEKDIPKELRSFFKDKK